MKITSSLLLILACFYFFSCETTEQTDDHSNKTDTVNFIASGKQTIASYMTAYARDINLVECYTMQSQSSRSRIDPLDLIKLQMMFETPFYKKSASMASWDIQPMGFSANKDSLIYNVLLSQVDVNVAFKELIPRLPKNNKDTVGWVVQNLSVYIDSVRSPAMATTTRRYLVTKDKCGHLLVNPANVDDLF
ncbi:MAG: hypothetical protein IM631_13120 [Cytophagales bacterium]|nr:hypothetical protein [Cytophagales bacterium]MCA6372314.1 hypothetical protein [Cytophagales bacterium]MCA6382460.1 hypothetical protein [Cytophagales bacterium]